MLNYLHDSNSVTEKCPGKNGLAGPIWDERMVCPDHFWLAKNG